MADIEVFKWLESIGLSKYADIFGQHGIDGSVLPFLKAQDLTEIGVATVGHRRKLLKAIALFSQHAESAPGGESVERLIPSAAERRHMTVLSCDLAGSTALAINATAWPD